MSIQSTQLSMENEFKVLKDRISQTSEAWDDPVQKKFYGQFLDNIPKEFQHYMAVLTKLDEIFDRAERRIQKL